MQQVFLFLIGWSKRKNESANGLWLLIFSLGVAGFHVALCKRGVKITVILDRGQKTAKYSSADFVSHAGITTLIDAKHAIAHNKVMVIDGLVLITGSFNFTKAAEEKNAENLLIIRDKDGLWTPLSRATIIGKRDVVNFLKQHGAE